MPPRAERLCHITLAGPWARRRPHDSGGGPSGLATRWWSRFCVYIGCRSAHTYTTRTHSLYGFCTRLLGWQAARLPNECALNSNSAHAHTTRIHRLSLSESRSAGVAPLSTPGGLVLSHSERRCLSRSMSLLGTRDIAVLAARWHVTHFVASMRAHRCSTHSMSLSRDFVSTMNISLFMASDISELADGVTSDALRCIDARPRVRGGRST